MGKHLVFNILHIKIIFFLNYALIPIQFLEAKRASSEWSAQSPITPVAHSGGCFKAFSNYSPLLLFETMKTGVPHMQVFPTIYNPGRQGEQRIGKQYYHHCNDLGNLSTYKLLSVFSL